MKRYRVKITNSMRGQVARSPLLMHQDSVEWADSLAVYRESQHGKKKRVRGDDRSPSWSWIGYVYYEGPHVCIPADNLMTMLREAGAKITLPKQRASLKSVTQTGIIVDEIGWPLEGPKGRIEMAKIKALMEEDDFEKHMEVAESLGFALFVKRAKLGDSKHVRVRPRFDSWSAEGTITVLDDRLSTAIVQDLFEIAGLYVGIGDWRPSAKKAPGRFGTFYSKVQAL